MSEDDTTEGGRTVPVESWGAMGDNGAEARRDKRQQTDFDAADEYEYNRRVYGLTYRERHGGKDVCIVLCKRPRSTPKAAKCPSCYQKIRVAPLGQAAELGLEPGPPRPRLGPRLARWLGEMAGAALEGLAVPFQRSRDHRAALIRDLLHDVVGEGFIVEMTCHECEVPLEAVCTRCAAPLTPRPRPAEPPAAPAPAPPRAPAAAELEIPAPAALPPAEPGPAELETAPVEYAEDAL
jgi:hypothetical protein